MFVSMNFICDFDFKERIHSGTCKIAFMLFNIKNQGLIFCHFVKSQRLIC